MQRERLQRKAGKALAGMALTGTALAGASNFTAAAQDPYAIPDAQLQQNVSQALHNDQQLSNIAIVATASQGTVTLKGTVATETMRAEAEQVVAGVSGVRSIQDNLDVGGAPAPAPAQTAQAQADQAPPPPDEPAGTAALPPPPPADAAPGQATAPAGAPGDWGVRGNAHVPQDYRSAAPAPAPPQQASVAAGPVVVPEGALLNIRTSEPLSTAGLKPGDFFQGTAASDVYAGGALAIPRGAVISGQVVEAKNAGPLGGSPKLELRLTGLQLGANSYQLISDTWSSQGPSKSGYTAANTVGGAAVGAAIGAVAGGGLGAGIGALAGGATGTLVSGATHGPRLDLPAEALLQFHLQAPLTVDPVSQQEAARLAASAPTPPTPVLRARPVYVAAPYPYYYGRPYPYYARPYPYGYYYGRF